MRLMIYNGIRRMAAVVILMVMATTMFAADPMATHYSFSQCEGSLTPYPISINPAVTPDSLEAVFVNHVGRHGSRYPASAANCEKLAKALDLADSLGTITPLGRKLRALNRRVIAESQGQWGALDSLGMAEQRAIATRMFLNFPSIFGGDATISAISSYSPRSMMSMFSFVHQLDRMNNNLTFITSTGRQNNALMRPFDVNADYIDFMKQGLWRPPYDEYFVNNCPITAITKVLGRDYPYGDTDVARDLAITEYYVLAGLSAMDIHISLSEYFTQAEINALWSCFNLRQYLQRTASVVSSIPADIASQLLLNLITTTDDAVAGDTHGACLRFGHAETLMPLLSLLCFPDCYYLTNYFDTVASHWRDFYVVPMAANLQIILFKAKKSGNYYVRFDLNETPVKLLDGRPEYLPWKVAREYMMNHVPIYEQ